MGSWEEARKEKGKGWGRRKEGRRKDGEEVGREKALRRIRGPFSRKDGLPLPGWRVRRG